MKKTCITILLLLFCCFSFICRGQSMAAVFSILPSQWAEELNPTLCKDLIDYYQAGVKATVTNRFAGQTTLELLTDDYLKMSLTEHTQVQMKLISYKDTVVVVMVHNYCAGACDGKVRFFDLTWKPLKMRRSPAVDLSDFIKKEASQTPQYGEIRSLIENPLFRYDLYPEHDSLSISWEIDRFLGQEQREKIAPFVQRKKIWFDKDNGKYIRKE